jgi:shikimate 5-dehydrogenase
MGGGGMSDAVLVALISGGLTLIGVLIANSRTQAVTDTKLEELTREVREHNNFAKRMPVVEEQIKVINHRIEDLEGFHKGN